MDFQSFKSLKKLVVGCGILLGEGSGIRLTEDTIKDHISKALPSSLEEFSVTKCGTTNEAGTIVGCLETMIRVKEEKFPRLEKLHWCCRWYYESGIVLEKESPRLRERAELKAIELTTFIEETRPDNEPATDARPWLSVYPSGVRPLEELAMLKRRSREARQYMRDRYEEEERLLYAAL